jgi:hypothetical protein
MIMAGWWPWKIKPGSLKSSKMFMDILIIDKSLLLDLITSCYGQGETPGMQPGE